jgi:hypothetical protein
MTLTNRVIITSLSPAGPKHWRLVLTYENYRIELDRVSDAHLKSYMRVWRMAMLRQPFSALPIVPQDEWLIYVCREIAYRSGEFRKYMGAFIAEPIARTVIRVK